jgi:hypothetical protein
LAENEARRCYFYNVDLQGRLFLEEVLPKNIATCIKDNKFLNFFFSRIRKTSERDHEFMDSHNVPPEDYPFVSPCGKELNFIRPAATPIVFHTLQDNQLLFGGDLSQPFDPEKLAVSQHTGRLHHQLSEIRLERHGGESREYGLVRSSVAVTLAEHIVHGENDRLNFGSIPLALLPQHAEPGPYAMPFVEGME